ncbi:type III pantothenate kinase [Flavobacterium sp. 103]|uniref:type III pantothenate kinase n=1 Tax=unclassified Flavobacterium TaxID=196869 RepID=UPI000D5F6B8F|nr:MULTISPECIES: type III pantothenate kinase [unclassified Flavobacterium]PVX46272.1 type III pantothenate kinase [Flavobacterium sp. 103]QKJ61608.1 type III pantothenate kinase [Flavobacterium sp. M31R6]
MVLTVDIGNTRIKAAVFEGYNTMEIFVFSKDEIQEKIEIILKKYKKVMYLVVASVGNVDKNLFLCFQKDLDVWFVSNEDAFPFTNNYATPKTLGIDRMVLAAGATLQFQGKNRLIIDAGTCVTYDFVDEMDVYHGGAISPGLRLRYESLHNFTEKLPLLTVESPKYFVGDSTAEAIHSGVVNGLVYEINGFVDEYQSKYSNFIIILTGGDTEFLAKRLKNTIFANSNFLLESLNQIFQYKIEND